VIAWWAMRIGDSTTNTPTSPAADHTGYRCPIGPPNMPSALNIAPSSTRRWRGGPAAGWTVTSSQAAPRPSAPAGGSIAQPSTWGVSAAPRIETSTDARGPIGPVTAGVTGRAARRAWSAGARPVGRQGPVNGGGPWGAWGMTPSSRPSCSSVSARSVVYPSRRTPGSTYQTVRSSSGGASQHPAVWSSRTRAGPSNPRTVNASGESQYVTDVIAWRSGSSPGPAAASRSSPRVTTTRDSPRAASATTAPGGSAARYGAGSTPAGTVSVVVAPPSRTVP
jgi:hypothetical protein